jgi:hypothetical protein
VRIARFYDGGGVSQTRKCNTKETIVECGVSRSDCCCYVAIVIDWRGTTGVAGAKRVNWQSRCASRFCLPRLLGPLHFNFQLPLLIRLSLSSSASSCPSLSHNVHCRKQLCPSGSYNSEAWRHDITNSTELAPLYHLLPQESRSINSKCRYIYESILAGVIKCGRTRQWTTFVPKSIFSDVNSLWLTYVEPRAV